MHLYLATGLTGPSETGSARTTTSVSELVRLPFEEALARADDGRDRTTPSRSSRCYWLARLRAAGEALNRPRGRARIGSAGAALRVGARAARRPVACRARARPRAGDASAPRRCRPSCLSALAEGEVAVVRRWIDLEQPLERRPGALVLAAVVVGPPSASRMLPFPGSAPRPARGRSPPGRDGGLRAGPVPAGAARTRSPGRPPPRRRIRPATARPARPPGPCPHRRTLSDVRLQDGCKDWLRPASVPGGRRDRARKVRGSPRRRRPGSCPRSVRPRAFAARGSRRR